MRSMGEMRSVCRVNGGGKPGRCSPGISPVKPTPDYFFGRTMMADRLNHDQSHSTNQYLFSNNGKDILVMQSDGNLVVYEVLSDGGRRVLGGSETFTPDSFAEIPPPAAFADFPDEGQVGSSGED